MFVAWSVFLFPMPKLEYNELHPYFVWVPILTYIFARNIT